MPVAIAAGTGAVARSQSTPGTEGRWILTPGGEGAACVAAERGAAQTGKERSAKVPREIRLELPPRPRPLGRPGFSQGSGWECSGVAGSPQLRSAPGNGGTVQRLFSFHGRNTTVATDLFKTGNNPKSTDTRIRQQT